MSVANFVKIYELKRYSPKTIKKFTLLLKAIKISNSKE